MELRKITVAVIGALCTAPVFAVSEPTPQIVDRAVHFDHDHEVQHGIEDHKPQYSPQKSLPLKPKPEPTIEDVSPFNALSAGTSALQGPEVSSALPCDVNAFNTSNSSTLITQITGQGAQCVNELFSASSDIQRVAFSSSNMYQVAKHTSSLSRSYRGGGSDDLEALFLYLRAGYYAEFYDNSINFASWVQPAVKEAVDSFVNSGSFYENSDPHGKVLGEVITTMDSAGLQHDYLGVVTEWLNRWDRSYAQNWYMRNAVNGVFTVLFGGQWNDQFVSQIGSQTGLVEALSQFALNRNSIGQADEFMTANAGRELGRLTQYKNTSIAPSVVGKLRQIFDQYQMYGYGDSVWLATADSSSYYVDCSEFGICNFDQELKSLVLSQTYVCSDTIRILSQNMTPEQHRAACSKMGYEEGYFHQRLETGRVPVPDDHNIQLQVNIFDSDDDYGKYAGPIFDIDTNNGGMYLEGEPGTPGNIPNFIAYEASYANADHFVWNLEHEYVHYLDGRFDLYGGFNHPTEKVVWWAEGVAEYVANEDNNPRALETIMDGSTYTLAEIFETTYDGFDVDRIYRWGYLAVRFMFERHMNEVNAMLADTRQGNWSAYKATITQWANLYQSEFEQWQQQLVNGGGGALTPPTAAISMVSEGKVNETITFGSSRSTDSDGQIVHYFWEFGDGATSTEANPTHQFSRAGTYTVRLTITDNDGLTASTYASITITEDQAGGNNQLPQDCAVRPKVGGGQLTAGEPVCLASQSTIWLAIPAVNEYRSMSITSANGTGDLKLEYSNFSWPNSYGSNLHGWSANPGNSECITIVGQANYWGYLKVSGEFDNAALVVDFDSEGCRH
ncbi:collagenase [Vibrio sinaloensis]|uniref:collagenase n=1 Tax=Photobacterium sp. (strain ATCC 43367) TaxID=379097 RepID=UPI00057FEA44|nr:collagenase [Vibrio sinaloensis]KHT44014.1 collagenase [Vibrio sinaloensis]